MEAVMAAAAAAEGIQGADEEEAFMPRVAGLLRRSRRAG